MKDTLQIIFGLFGGLAIFICLYFWVLFFLLL